MGSEFILIRFFIYPKLGVSASLPTALGLSRVNELHPRLIGWFILAGQQLRRRPKFATAASILQTFLSNFRSEFCVF